LTKPEAKIGTTVDKTVPLLIVNPKSAGGATREKWSGIAADFRAHFGPFSVAFTKKSGDGRDLAIRGAESGRRFIIACGGDGTLNEVANGILESGLDVEFGILPSGTGGDFRKTIGISNETRTAARQLRTGRTIKMDVGRVSFTGIDGLPAHRYFINVSSFGLSSTVANGVASKTVLNWVPLSGPMKGKAKYAVSTLEVLSELKSRILRVRLDGKAETNLASVNLCVCNSRYFGGGMKIAPAASITDGLFEVVNIGDVKALKVLANLPRLYSGTHTRMEEVSATQARTIEVSAADGSPMPLETDGEVVGTLPARYELIPKALKIRVPEEA
jgi:YegS/Rv2252/BmrU family lipid kinase